MELTLIYFYKFYPNSKFKKIQNSVLNFREIILFSNSKIEKSIPPLFISSMKEIIFLFDVHVIIVIWWMELGFCKSKEHLQTLEK